ncbi:MAG: hypothetical protein WCL16_00210, partial [bacterium]
MPALAASSFQRLCTPGQNMFCIWAAAYAPPLDGAPAQVFLGEWTGTTNGADLIAVELDSGRQTIIGFDGISSTQCLGVDPYRPVLWIATDKQLLELDRRTLSIRVACEITLVRPTMDVDRQHRVWCAETRSLSCFDPATNKLT